MKKRVGDSLTENAYFVQSSHINGYGRLFGGDLMRWMDVVAGIVSRRHCGKEITTAAIDQLVFKEPAFVNDIVVLVGKITYVGRSSMEVRVDAFVEEREDGTRRLINHAYFVMVAIDENGKPIEVPGLVLENENQQIEWEGGKKRYLLRKDRKLEGY
ncbi:MAG TPA: acyl-CoA thioesterase [Candidatus Merdenecus merdavium]|nr:acyl-CoA thioesterase [Candidatus Merdenecus merdavium]